MKDKERDMFDDLFRSKLQDFESDTMPDDWEAIANRLPVKRPVPFRRALRYWAAAAVISLLVVTGGVYLSNQEPGRMPMAEVVQDRAEVAEMQPEERPEAMASVVSTKSSQYKRVEPVVAPVAVSRSAKPAVAQIAVVTDDTKDEEAAPVRSESDRRAQSKPDRQAQPESRPVQTRALIADATPVQEEKKKPAKRWGFGMGGGSVSTGTSNSVNSYALKSSFLNDKELLQLNSPYFNDRSPKTNIRHKTPISVGLGVSYYLNDRFSLQSGLNYTLLASEWETSAVYNGETKQKLHFIGIPLSLSYKIAEWERIQFYAAAGVMTEVNVAGKQRAKIFIEQDEIRREEKSVRMKEWMWSANVRAGASYPLLRFLSIYAEVGASYYFDNGSYLETVRSEKPFNVNLQAGFRFGF